MKAKPITSKLEIDEKGEYTIKAGWFHGLRDDAQFDLMQSDSQLEQGKVIGQAKSISVGEFASSVMIRTDEELTNNATL